MTRRRRSGARSGRSALYRWVPVDRHKLTDAAAEPGAKTETSSSDAGPDDPEAVAEDVGATVRACGAAFALFKPPNVVTTMSEVPSQLSGGASLSAWLREIQVGLQPIGRLDKNTSGLLLVAPRRLVAAINAAVCAPGRCSKSYICCTDRPLSATALARLRGGVALDEGVMKPLKAEELSAQRVPRIVRRLASERHPEVRSWHFLLLEIDVGWYHVVKRVMQAVGSPVLHLHRHGIAHVSLDSIGLLEPRTHTELPASALGALLARNEGVPVALATALDREAALSCSRGRGHFGGRGARLARGRGLAKAVGAVPPAPGREALRRRKGNVWIIDLSDCGLTDEEAEAFAEEILRPWLTEQSGAVVFSAVELGENPALGARGLSAILGELLLGHVHVERVKFYRTAADDEALRAVAEWMMQLPAGQHPFEVHFSHCQVADAGLLALLRAASVRGGRMLWAQLAKNNISPDLVESLAAEGTACLAHDRPACGPKGCKLKRPPLVHLSGGRVQRGSTAGRRSRGRPAAVDTKAVEAALAKWQPLLADLAAARDQKQDEGTQPEDQKQDEGTKAVEPEVVPELDNREQGEEKSAEVVPELDNREHGEEKSAEVVLELDNREQGEEEKLVEALPRLDNREQGQEEKLAEVTLQLDGLEEGNGEKAAEVVVGRAAMLERARLSAAVQMDGEMPIRLGEFKRAVEKPCWWCMG